MITYQDVHHKIHPWKVDKFVQTSLLIISAHISRFSMLSRATSRVHQVRVGFSVAALEKHQERFSLKSVSERFVVVSVFIGAFDANWTHGGDETDFISLSQCVTYGFPWSFGDIQEKRLEKGVWYYWLKVIHLSLFVEYIWFQNMFTFSAVSSIHAGSYSLVYLGLLFGLKIIIR